MKKADLKTKSDCNRLLKEIEQDLVDAFPRAVKKSRIAQSAYGMLICYIDLTTDHYTPHAAVLPASHRDECIVNREVGYLWVLPELPTIDCVLPKTASVRRKCDLAYGFLSADWGDRDEFDVILPFRKMIYRVCKALNKFDWSTCLPVTDDFTVMASDWSTGAFIEEDANASVPAKQKNKLLKQGLFFNPRDLPKQKEIKNLSIKKISKASVEAQVAFWREQLCAFYDDRSCEAKSANYTVKRVVSRIAKFKKVGAESLLGFLEEKSGEPEWTSSDGAKEHGWGPTSRSKSLREVLDALKKIGSKSAAAEKRLWKCFESAVKVNKSAVEWGLLPAGLAFAIQAMFKKYNYWVISDIVTGKIESLAEIRRARRELGPK